MYERIGWGPGDLRFLGFQFSEQFVKAIDIALALFFFHLAVFWMFQWDRLKYGECSKAFGSFWIAHFACIIIFRLFQYLQRYFLYRMALEVFEEDNTQLRRAQFWAIIMLSGKLTAYFGFLVLTIIWSTWFFQRGTCVHEFKERFSWGLKMGFWLGASSVFCLAYAVRIVKMQIFDRYRPALINVDNGHFLRVGRSLTKSQLNGIQKRKLFKYDELSRFAKPNVRGVRQLTTEMSFLSTNHPELGEEKASIGTDSQSKQGDDDSTEVICAICQEEIEIGEWYKRLPQCEHCFHASCSDEWLSRRATCPVCRTEIFIDENSSQLDADRISMAVLASANVIRVDSNNSTQSAICN